MGPEEVSYTVPCCPYFSLDLRLTALNIKKWFQKLTNPPDMEKGGWAGRKEEERERLTVPFLESFTLRILEKGPRTLHFLPAFLSFLEKRTQVSLEVARSKVTLVLHWFVLFQTQGKWLRCLFNISKQTWPWGFLAFLSPYLQLGYLFVGEMSQFKQS